MKSQFICAGCLFVIMFLLIPVYGQQQWPMVNACRERTSWAAEEDVLFPPLSKDLEYVGRKYSHTNSLRGTIITWLLVLIMIMLLLSPGIQRPRIHYGQKILQIYREILIFPRRKTIQWYLSGGKTAWRCMP